MDDSCAVCADALEWAAYGQCGHREVCSTCVVRLRFVLEDRRCCICKTENPFIFITKAMGDYTRVITDFSVFPAGATEGKVEGGCWYHEDTQAYFDDAEHYRMVKAMCRLSCRVCDSEGAEGASRRRYKYKSVDQLKGHLFHQHKLFMCNLCLEGRKVFICEQKLYTRSQLNQHTHTGDSEVDGSESERGGFMGHPMCEFCKIPFYGDNELYMHMSTEHYTCHICQRQHPGQYDYYSNYDDLEIHFRQEHFLCEDEACLAKKFVVFQAEAEMKRHNTLEHGGHMSRSKRNAALQLPTSFRYRRNNDDDQRRGRGNGFRRDQQLSMAIEASLETSIPDVRARASPSGARPITDHGNTSQNGSTARSLESVATNSGSERPRSASHNQSSRVNPVVEESSFPPLSERESGEPSSRYAQSFQNSSSAAHLGAESFPPLPKAKKSNKVKSNRVAEGSGKNTLAARLHLRNKSSVLVRGSAWSRPSSNKDMGSSSSASSQTRSTSNQGIALSTLASPQLRSPTNPELTSSASESSIARAKGQEAASSLTILSGNSLGANSLKLPVSAHPWNTANVANKARHSASAPNLVEGCSSNNNTSSTACALAGNQGLHKTGYTASAVAGSQGLHRTGQPLSNAEGVQTANKSLVERIRASLGMDNGTFAAFKNISGEYRQGKINTWEYLSYVEQFGLSHLVLELAQLCPDPDKQKELTDAYTANLRDKGLQENGGSNSITSKEVRKGKLKGGVAHEGRSSSKDVLTDNFFDTVRKLQLNLKHGEEEVETLSKDGYRTAKGKQKLSASPAPANSGSASAILANPSFNEAAATNASASKGGSKKQQKKSSKFHRTRLGEGSVEAFLEPDHPIPSPEYPARESGCNTTEGLPVRGVWRNGGGMKLVAKSLKKSSK